MAEKLSKLFGTEEDKVNCPFFYKMGACRHGAQCDRKHHHPLSSPTVMVPHLFQNPMSAVVARGGTVSREEEAAMARDYEQTFIDIFDEVSRYGEVDEIQVCDNLNDHLVRAAGARPPPPLSLAPSPRLRSHPTPPSPLPPPAPGRWATCTSSTLTRRTRPLPRPSWTGATMAGGC